MTIKPGTKLHSAVSDVQVVVVRAPSVDVVLGCGGVPLLADGDDAPAGAAIDPALAEPTVIGKRYADEELGIELLCSKAGDGTLTCNGVPLALKGAKPLPASD
jgi:hypothetical protein